MSDKHESKSNKKRGEKSTGAESSEDSSTTSTSSTRAPGLTDLVNPAGAVGGLTLSPETVRKMPDKIRKQEDTIKALSKDAERMTLLLKKVEDENAARHAESVAREAELRQMLEAADSNAASALAVQEDLARSIRASEQEMAQLNARLRLREENDRQKKQDDQGAGPSNEDANRNDPSVKPLYNMPLITNKQFFDLYLGQKKLYRELIYFNGDFKSNYFIEEDEVALANVVSYLRVASDGDQNPMAMAKVLTLGEIAAAGLPDTFYMSTDDANKEFIRAWKWLYDGNPCQMIIGNVAEFKASNGAPQDIESMTDALALQAWVKKTKINFALTGTVSVASMIVAYTKQGNMTDGSLSKTMTALESEVGLSTRLDKGVINTFYSHYGSFIDDTRAESFFRYLSYLTPASCVRMHTLLAQSKYSRLTAICTIKNALIEYPDFSWDTVSNYFPTEWSNFKAGLRVMNNNPYFGFRQDLGAVKSTNFRSLAFVAKELLQQVGQDRQLAGFRGWATSIKHQSKIQELISAYMSTANSGGTDKGATKEEIKEVIKEIKEGRW